MSASVYDRRVKQFVTSDTVTLNADDTIHDALVLMSENRVSAIPVVDKRNRCIGILSAVDLIDLTRDADEGLRELYHADVSTKRFLVEQLTSNLGNEKVQTYMSESVVTVGMETLIARAAREMLRNHVHHLPVVDHENHLMGIISTMDILAEFSDAAPE